MKSNIKMDLAKEQLVGSYLDKYFYSKLPCLFKRVRTKKFQIQGIDVVLKGKNKLVFIDEKCQLTELGTPTPSFAFELSYVTQAKKEKEGWFLKKGLKTDIYALGYFNEMNKGIKHMKDLNFIDDIKDMDIVFVGKKCIQKFLAKKGFNEAFLEREARKLRENVDNGNTEGLIQRKTGFRKTLIPGVGLFISTSFAERPVNVVINRFILDEIAFYVFSIKDGVLSIKRARK